MITGYNTDVKHEGTVYHVQTEDGGKDNPVIVSLIYQGGRILASKKTSYAQFLGSEGFLARLRHLLEVQHRAMIQAVTSGAVARLKTPAGSAPAARAAAAAPEPSPAPPPHAAASAPKATAAPPQAARPQQQPPTPATANSAVPVTEKNLDQVILEYLASEIDKE